MAHPTDMITFGWPQHRHASVSFGMTPKTMIINHCKQKRWPNMNRNLLPQGMFSHCIQTTLDSPALTYANPFRHERKSAGNPGPLTRDVQTLNVVYARYWKPLVNSIKCTVDRRTPGSSLRLSS